MYALPEKVIPLGAESPVESITRIEKLNALADVEIVPIIWNPYMLVTDEEVTFE